MAEAAANGVAISELADPATEADIAALVAVHRDAIAGGASVSFMADTPEAEISAWWRRAVSEGERAVILVARDGAGTISGTVQLQPAWAPNQPHRAEVAKLLVHRSVRKQGIGEALMAAIEGRAAEAGFTLLTLDTASDSAERLYRRRGWIAAGRIPGFALNPDGSPCDTVIYFKQLR
jgi:GNAT superfamily N-acetyltransferase